ncbi:MAG: hypothetical protein KC492_08190, partial [Myxococcales bacterium]|nr:hypothetical protein [Myxococcales bacterium]
SNSSSSGIQLSVVGSKTHLGLHAKQLAQTESGQAASTSTTGKCMCPARLGGCFILAAWKQ